MDYELPLLCSFRKMEARNHQAAISRAFLLPGYYIYQMLTALIGNCLTSVQHKQISEDRKRKPQTAFFIINSNDFSEGGKSQQATEPLAL